MTQHDGRDRVAPLRLVQITDCHLGERPGSRLLNVDTDHSLASVLKLVRARESRIDVLLVTGDVADQGGPKAYRRLLANTRELGAAVRWLPGNHDNPAVMRTVLRGDVRLQRNLLSDHWQIIMLDSTVPNAVGGNLATVELAALRECLQEHPQRHALICVHHQVMPVGCAWIDEQKVANAAHFWREIESFSQVRAVLSGHVHQEFEAERGGVRVFTSPSTCIQFAPGSDGFRVDTLSPGYRWLDLHADGRIETGIERVSGVQFEVDLSASGY